MAAELEAIGATLAELARTAATPKDLLRAVRARHPRASRKLISRAALHHVIVNSDRDVATAQKLQDFAIRARGPED